MTDVISPYSRSEAQAYILGFSYAHNAAAAAFRIDDLSLQCHMSSVATGWYSVPETGEPKARNFGELVALMHSELSEALEGDRKSAMSDKIPEFTAVEEEFADALIRIFDTAGARKLRLGEAFQAKMRYNRTRADHKLEARAAAGGKKF